MKNKFILLMVFGLTIFSCGKESLFFEKFIELFKSTTPSSMVAGFEVNNDTPKEVMIYNENLDGDVQSMGFLGGNWSGNNSGPSFLEISFDKDKKMIVVYSKNTTGTIYTGYSVWEDTFYLSFKDVWKYEKQDENDENITFHGIGLKENPKSLNGTSGYIGNIEVSSKNPNVLSVLIFGGGKSNWQIQGELHFKEKSLINNFDNLRNLINGEK